MCFTIGPAITNTADKLFGNKDEIVCYKVIRRRIYRFKGQDSVTYVTPCMEEKISLGKTRRSNRRSKKVSAREYDIGEVSRGIHVHLRASKAKDLMWCGDCVVRVFCRKEDYVIHGDEEAVFMKVRYDTKPLYKHGDPKYVW